MASRSTHKGNHALVFGASGVTGWAIMNNAVNYPTPATFERVIGLTNRPLSISDAYLPRDSRLELYSGADLSNKASVMSKLQEIPDIGKVTHVYFAAYTAHGSDFQELKRANLEILKNAVETLEVLCPNMQFFTLQTGGKVPPASPPHPLRRTKR
jgi:nucleoside-diphosphate-sugar epimerase